MNIIIITIQENSVEHFWDNDDSADDNNSTTVAASIVRIIKLSHVHGIDVHDYRIVTVIILNVWSHKRYASSHTYTYTVAM